jgi:hypothetical protein
VFGRTYTLPNVCINHISTLFAFKDSTARYGSSVFGRFTELLDPRSTKAALRRSGRNVHLPPDAETDGCGEARWGTLLVALGLEKEDRDGL